MYNFDGKYLSLDREIKGEIILTDSQLVFLASEDVYNNSIICRIEEIAQVWERKSEHKDLGIEFFLTSSNSFLLLFDHSYDRDIIKNYFVERIENSSENYSLDTIVQRWKDGSLTNFDYLMELNKMGGRTFNDLMQYPVFPWILAKYDGQNLDLLNEDSYRKLEKPVPCQCAVAEANYVKNYQYLEQTLREHPRPGMTAYHYSSLYSNPGTVLHFLVRVPPFTTMFLSYQDNNFDIPDRTFHALLTTYNLVSKESSTDVKELIPEFFFLPEILENSEGFNFGVKQNGVMVDDIVLPEWCNGSARLFTLIHRQALESDVVRRKLNHWIDLIYGYKQRGQEAVKEVNVYYPTSYEDFPITAYTDSVERNAYETMIRTYGQAPKQIFKSPHPKAKISNSKMNNDAEKSVLKNVKGLKWGNYTGSLQLSPPKVTKTHYSRHRKIECIVPVDRSSTIHLLPEKTALMEGNQYSNVLHCVMWGQPDDIVRIQSLSRESSSTTCLFHVSSADQVSLNDFLFNFYSKIPFNFQITACGSHLKHKNLWFGYKSGKISVFQRTSRTQLSLRSTRNHRLESIIGIRGESSDDSQDILWSSPITLVRHTEAIVDLKISVEFKVVVSIGADNLTVIWDLNRLEHVRSIEPSCNTLDSRLSLVTISPTLGDIVTIFNPKNESIEEVQESDVSMDGFVNINVRVEKSQLRLHTVNGKYVNHTYSDANMTAVGYTTIKEGSGVNAIAVGLQTGVIKLFSSWNLSPIRDIDAGNASIQCLIYNSTNRYLVVLTNFNLIRVFESETEENSDRMAPVFNDIVPTF